MKILVVGGHGFLGSHVVEKLNQAGHETIALSRQDGLDLRDYAKTKEMLGDISPQVLFNCAAHVGSLHYVSSYAADVIHDNVQMALNLYRGLTEACPRTPIINPLSNCSYPGDANIHYEPDWWKGEVHESVSSYANAKRMIYVLAKAYKKQHGIRSINFLVPNAYGPGDYTDPNKTHALNGMIIRMIQAKKASDKEFEIWGSGNPIREWGYIKDVAEILVQSIELEHDLTYPVNIAQNKGYSIRQSAELISEAVGFQGQLVFNTKYQDGAPTKILDDRKFRSIFPHFEFYDHRQGIQDTAAYYQSLL